MNVLLTIRVILADPQKRLELFRKLDPLSTVARPPKRVERTSYFSKQGLVQCIYLFVHNMHVQT